jgi:hypothetical protein
LLRGRLLNAPLNDIAVAKALNNAAPGWAVNNSHTDWLFATHDLAK